MLQTKLKTLILGSAAAMLAVAYAVPAQAQTTFLYSGGGTLAEKVYRDVMNCYGSHGGGAGNGDTTIGLPSAAAGCSAATPYSAGTEILYLGVGSGNGKKGFVAHDGGLFVSGSKKADAVPVGATTDSGSYYGTGSGATWAPVAGSGPFYPKVSFVGSDDPLTTGDITTYNTNSNGWGAPIQIPGLITTIAIPYSPIGTWNEHGKKPAGGGNSGLVNLSINTLCGIFNGDIQNWNNAAITADNGGVQLGSGQITVVYRSDGSGSTFLFSNGLVQQCATSGHPILASWQTAANPTVGASSPATNASGLGNNNWFLNVAAAGLLPGNFVGASGSGALKLAIQSGAGRVGYISPDFVLPVDTSTTVIGGVPTAAPKAANLQTYASFAASATPVWKAPTGKNGTAIVGAVKAPSSAKNSCDAGHATGTAPLIQASDGICAHNPLNWGLAFPKPASLSAYPIGGFTFIDTYTCYHDAADATALAGATAGSLGYLRWFFGTALENSSHVKTELNNNGFALVPGGWISAAKKLLTTDKVTKVSTPGTAGTGCAAVAGNGA